MARRSRVRRIAKWAGTCLSFLILAIWGLSYAEQGRVFWAIGRCYVAIGNGGVGLYWWLPDSTPPHHASNEDLAFVSCQLELIAARGWRPTLERGTWGGGVYSRLWMPTMLFAIPTAVLWIIDRRRIPPGHCRTCGYNLTGNLSGRCPECGSAASAADEGERSKTCTR